MTTRGLQEWLCLLPQEVPFATAHRLLGWLAREPEVISTTQLRRWVQHHGGLIRQAEQAQVYALQERERLDNLQAHLVPNKEPRWPAAWEKALNDTAVAVPRVGKSAACRYPAPGIEPA